MTGIRKTKRATPDRRVLLEVAKKAQNLAAETLETTVEVMAERKTTRVTRRVRKAVSLRLRQKRRNKEESE